MSIADDLEELLGELGPAGTAVEALDSALGGLNSTATSTGEKLARIASPLDAASKATEALGSAAKGAAPAVLNAGQGASGAAKAFDVLQNKATGLLESLVPTSGALGTVAQMLKALGPEGEAAAIALGILVTVVTGLAQTLWDWAAAAVAAAQKRDALMDAFDALGGGAGAGERTLALTSKIAADLPFVTSQVNAWAKAMAMVGKEGGALDQSVKAIAASAAITRTAGEAAQSLIKRWALMGETGQKVKLDRRQLSALAESGADLNELARILGVTKDKLGGMSLDAKKLGDAFEQALINKGGPALEDLGLTWDSIKAKFNEGLGSVFSGMSDAVKPLMVEIKGFFAEFNKGSTTMNGAKSVMASILKVIFDWATRATHAIHIGFLSVQIAALQVYIALAPLVRIMRALYSNADVLRGLKILALLLIAPFALVAVVLGAIVSGLVIVGTAISYVAGLVIGAISFLVGGIASGVKKAIGFLVDLATGGDMAATNFVNGIVKGISDGAGEVADAVRKLAEGALEAFTSFFQIKSPSRRMRAHGRQLPAGAAEGVDDGAVELEESIDGMWEPKGPAKPRLMREAAGRGRGRDINFNNCQFFGTSKEQIRELMLLVLDEEAAAGPEPA